MSTSEQDTPQDRTGKCTAPTESPCPYKVYAELLCEGHYRRTIRAQESGRQPNLSTPIREARGPLKAVHTRITESAHLYFNTHPAGEYESLRQVLETHAAGELAKLSGADLADLEDRAKALKKSKKRRLTRRRRLA